MARLGDGWVTLAPTLERFTAARHKIDHYAAGYGRADRCRTSALYVAFNLQINGERARLEGWRWMERFFGQPKEKLAHFFTIFGTPAECVRALNDYAAAGSDNDHCAHRVGRPTRAIAYTVERDQTTIDVARRSRKSSPQKAQRGHKAGR